MRRTRAAAAGFKRFELQCRGRDRDGRLPKRLDNPANRASGLAPAHRREGSQFAVLNRCSQKL